MPVHLTALPFSFVTGNFAVSCYGARYLWSGVSISRTGTLASPVSISGAQMIVKNISTGASLLLTGVVDYGVNYTVVPRANVALWSDGASWLVG